MISQAEKNAIKRILQDPNWGAVQKVSEMVVQSIQEQSVNKDTEWETVRGLIERDAKVQAIRELIAELYKQAL